MSISLSVANAAFFTAFLLSNLVWGHKIGGVSGRFESAFVPAKFSFAVWTPLFVILSAAVIAQFFNPDIAADWGPYFMLQCATNIAWLFSFVHGNVRVSAVFIVASTAFVVIVYLRCQRWSSIRSASNAYRLTSVAFSLYLGWLLLASVAGVSVAAGVHRANVFLRCSVWLILVASVVALQASFMDPLLSVTAGWGAFGVSVRHGDAVAFTASLALTVSYTVTQAISILKSQ